MVDTKNIILLNNLFNGEYVKDKLGGEIINMYQSDNNNYYIYVNPYGNVNKKWDNRIKHILFIRSVGNRVVKIIAKAEISQQINLNAIVKIGEGIDGEQKKYIDENNITYGNVKVYDVGSWSNYFVTFEAKSIYKAKTDIFLATNSNQYNKSKNIFILEDIDAINNQSQKLYIEPNSKNYKTLEDIVLNIDFWEENTVSKVNVSEQNVKKETFLSIIKKEKDELVNSNLLAYFLENDKKFWSAFVKQVLEIEDENLINIVPKITRESIGNIDLFIEVGDYVIVIENKIKSGISGRRDDGYSQLEKYINKTEEYVKNNISNSKLKIHYYILRPNYNNEDYTVYNRGLEYKEIKYSKILKIFDNFTDREFDFYFNEFKKLIEKHSADYDNELFEIMNDRFIEEIKMKQKEYKRL